MNFLACDGSWGVGASGEAICTGTLVTLTEQEMQSMTALTWDDVSSLQGSLITLFALAFGFLVLKNLLKK